MKFYNNFNEMYSNNVKSNNMSVFNARGNYITKLGRTYEVSLNGIPFVWISFDREEDPILFAGDNEWQEFGYTNDDFAFLEETIMRAFDSFCTQNGYEYDESTDFAGYPLKRGLSNEDGRNFAATVRDIIKGFEEETGTADKELPYNAPYLRSVVLDKYTHSFF